MSEPRTVLAVIPDLFFAVKVAATARACGVTLASAAPRNAAAHAARIRPALVLLDLHAADALATVSALKSLTPAPPLVGFFSHVETALRDSALAAGADAVLARSQFTHRLAGLLARGLDSLTEPAPGGSLP